MLAGVGLVGLAGAITACGASASSSSTPAAGNAATPGGPVSGAASGGAGGGGSSAPAGNALASTSQIPVGGGMVFSGKQVVVTQPSAGEFKAFSAVCTHMGCTVNQVSNGTIDCPCHGSQYSIKTGDVVAGPAPKPLPPKQIKVSGESIFLE
jgi:Rieske Fe-S protein